MIRIGILGDIGSGKSYVSSKFGYPVFNADKEVTKLYLKDKKVFKRLNRVLPNYIKSFPINKNQLVSAILAKEKNLKNNKNSSFRSKKKMNIFLKKTGIKKAIILDVPLLLENKLNKEKDILIFVQSNKSLILRRLKKRNNFNYEIIKKFKKIQLPLDYKKKKSHFIIKNNFTPFSVKKV